MLLGFAFAHTWLLNSTVVTLFSAVDTSIVGFCDDIVLALIAVPNAAPPVIRPAAVNERTSKEAPPVKGAAIMAAIVSPRDTPAHNNAILLRELTALFAVVWKSVARKDTFIRSL